MLSPGVILLHENVVEENIQQKKRVILERPPYRPDLPPCDFVPLKRALKDETMGASNVVVIMCNF